MMNFVAINDQIGDGSFGISAINGNAKSVAAAPGSIAALERLFNVMNIIFQQFDMRTRTDDVDAHRTKPMFRGVEVADLQPLDSHITLVLDGENALPACVKCPASSTAVSPG